MRSETSSWYLNLVLIAPLQRKPPRKKKKERNNKSMCVNVNIYLFEVYLLSVCSKQSTAGYTKASEMRNGLLRAEVSSRKANSKVWAVIPTHPQTLHLRLHLPGKSLPSHGAKSSHLLLQPPAPPAPKAVSVPLAMLRFPMFSLAPPWAWEGKNCLYPLCPQSPAQRYSRNLLPWIK